MQKALRPIKRKNKIRTQKIPSSAQLKHGLPCKISESERRDLHHRKEQTVQTILEADHNAAVLLTCDEVTEAARPFKVGWSRASAVTVNAAQESA